MDIKSEVKLHAKECEDIITAFLAAEEGYQKTVIEAMNYAFLAGGKRLRPMLMLETYKLFGGQSESVKNFMAALEMIHTYSLIHDDLPALDNDDYRRGRKTTHVVYGEAMAILAGDGLLNYAFETAADAFIKYPEDKNLPEALKILTVNAGIYGMLGGQCADVEAEGQDVSADKLDFIYRLKTGALIESAMLIGAVIAGADSEQKAVVKKVAANIGMAFQIQDDVLDIIGDQAVLGKPIGSDEKNNKNTYAVIYGVEAAQAKVKRLTDEAIELLHTLPAQNEYLERLLCYLVYRDN